MLKVKTVDRVSIGSGTVVGLNEDQVRRRKGSLEKKGKEPGIYLTTRIVKFKGGEEIQVESIEAIPKGFRKSLEGFENPRLKARDEKAEKKKAPKKAPKKAATKK